MEGSGAEFGRGTADVDAGGDRVETMGKGSEGQATVPPVIR
jgi:hypothetical protein